MPVGRLDMNTEGLLLLTTDGELKRALELPSSGVERVYRARVFGEVSQAQLEELIHGIEIDRSEEHTSELQSLMRISYAVFCLKKKKIKHAECCSYQSPLITRSMLNHLNYIHIGLRQH